MGASAASTNDQPEGLPLSNYQPPQRQVEKRGANHGLHVFLSIITCGLWAITGWPIAAAMGRKTVTVTKGGAVPYAAPQPPPGYVAPPPDYGPPQPPYGPPQGPYPPQGQTPPRGTTWGQPPQQ